MRIFSRRSATRVTASSLCALLLSACSSIPDEGQQPNLGEISESQISDWEYIPAVTHRSYRQDLGLVEPGNLPGKLYDLPLSLDLDRAISVDRLVPYLEQQGVSVVIADSGVGSREVTIPRYNGSLGKMLNILSETTNLSFRWSNNALVIDSADDYIISVPQNETLIEGVESALNDIGAQDVSTSQSAGLVSYSASTHLQKKVSAYLDQLSSNTALINLQVAVVNVSLNKDQSSGLNWSSLSAQVGDLGLVGGESDSGGPGEGEGSGSVSAANQAAASISGSSINFLAEGGDVSLQAVLSMLSIYGESRTTQNLTLKTLSGIPVSLRSGRTIPYIDSLETIDASDSDGATISGTDISELETGFEVEISPYYDGASEIVTVNLEVALKSLTGFRELVSESATGAIRQPETRDQELNSIVRLEAGETALLGGLVFESTSDNRSTLRGLEKVNAGGKNTELSKNALFILMRPTVTVYGPRYRVNGGDK